jgi:hypothetical protein
VYFNIKVLVVKSNGKRPPDRQHNIETCLKTIRWESVDWIHPVKDRHMADSLEHGKSKL